MPPESKSQNPGFPGAVAEWLCSGLQLRVRRFDSDPRLHFTLAFQLLTISENNRRLSRERFPNFFHLSQRFQRRF